MTLLPAPHLALVPRHKQHHAEGMSACFSGNSTVSKTAKLHFSIFSTLTNTPSYKLHYERCRVLAQPTGKGRHSMILPQSATARTDNRQTDHMSLQYHPAARRPATPHCLAQPRPACPGPHHTTPARSASCNYNTIHTTHTVMPLSVTISSRTDNHNFTR